MIDNKKVFLGGTCAKTNWREELIPLLTGKYFNPVVKDWTEECQEIEELMKAYSCGVHLYHITSEMKGVFSIAEAVESSHDDSKVTVFTYNPEGFDKGQCKSLIAVGALVKRNGGHFAIVENMHGVATAISQANEANILGW